jgi:hypothetical protein
VYEGIIKYGYDINITGMMFKLRYRYTTMWMYVSEGESSTSIGKMKRNFYYTSPNEKAWKEKMKISGMSSYVISQPGI